MFGLHRGFLTSAIYHRIETVERMKLCVTKISSLTVRAKETPVEPDKHRALVFGQDPRAYRRAFKEGIV